MNPSNIAPDQTPAVTVAATSTEQRLYERYGFYLTTEEMAEVLKYKSAGAVRTAISTEKFPKEIVTVRIGKNRLATIESVAHFIDKTSMAAQGQKSC